MVAIKTDSGKTLKVKLAVLSQADQDYVAKRAK